jgi:hypothetical protein
MMWVAQSTGHFCFSKWASDLVYLLRFVYCVNSRICDLQESSHLGMALIKDAQLGLGPFWSLVLFLVSYPGGCWTCFLLMQLAQYSKNTPGILQLTGFNNFCKDYSRSTSTQTSSEIFRTREWSGFRHARFTIRVACTFASLKPFSGA